MIKNKVIIIKRIILVAFCLCALLNFCACSSQNKATDSKIDSNSSSAAQSSSVISNVSSAASDSESSQAQSKAESAISKQMSVKEIYENKIEQVKNDKGTVDKGTLTAGKNNITGYVNHCIIDLDGDGKEELVVVNSLGDKNLENELMVFSVDGEKISNPQTVDAGSEAVYTVYGYNDAFLVKHDDGYYICTNTYNTGDYSGVPSEQKLKIFKYADSKVSKLAELGCKNTSVNSITLSLNGTDIYESNNMGIPKGGYPASSLEEAVGLLKSELDGIGLSEKIYVDKSGSEIVGISFNGFNSSLETEKRLCYRKEALSSSDYKTLQVSFK